MLKGLIAFIIFLIAACHQPVSAPDVSLEQIMEKHVAALGDTAALQRIKSQRINALIKSAVASGTMTTFLKSPDKVLIITRIGSQEIITGYDGNAAWARNAQGVRPISAEHSDRIRSGAAVNVLLGCRKTGGKIELVGVESVDAQSCYILQMTWKDGKRTKAFVSSRDFLLLKTISSIKAPASRKPVVVEVHFTNFRRVEGVLMPFEMSVNGKYGKYNITVESYEVNVQLNDSIFHASSQG